MRHCNPNSQIQAQCSRLKPHAQPQLLGLPASPLPVTAYDVSTSHAPLSLVEACASRSCATCCDLSLDQRKPAHGCVKQQQRKYRQCPARRGHGSANEGYRCPRCPAQTHLPRHKKLPHSLQVSLCRYYDCTCFCASCMS